MNVIHLRYTFNSCIQFPELIPFTVHNIFTLFFIQKVFFFSLAYIYHYILGGFRNLGLGRSYHLQVPGRASSKRLRGQPTTWDEDVAHQVSFVHYGGIVSV